MVREIVKGNNQEGLEFLTQKSVSSNPKADTQLYQDLIETAEAHRENCLGLAAVQIGEHKRAVVVLINDKFELFINPVIVGFNHETYEATEGCLSLEGTRTVRRYKTIIVLYKTRNGKIKKMFYSGLTAQILQHEIDHCNGVLI